MTTLYHNPRCSKSRAAVALLEEHGLEFETVKYLQDAPNEKELTKIVKMLGIPPSKLVRKGEKRFKELDLANQDLTDKQWIAILAENPVLIERPIVVHNGKAAIGRPLENVTEILNQ
ncbi:arsenate reductase [Neorhodopirellula lusitana]|uniref:Arsenate reductase n=1 Tax=Neorhodopirellula lusitana TaxID=445327 RepID=A0ABY1PTV9_9BACT|nr:arsenate reductase (glutaredoxin) [Neorhodopirellula lusitana]SMP45882.1 arsenate reductase [Neorhodopirellula lusitana]